MNDKKTYQGFPNYDIYINGSIYSCKTRKWLKPSKYNNGYLYVSLSNKGVIKKIAIHRIIAELFIPNNNNLPQVNHKDLNKLNNDLSNLEWITIKDNLNHGHTNGTSHAGRSLSTETVLKIREYLKDGVYPKEIGKIMNIDYRIVSKIKQGINYKHVR